MPKSRSVHALERAAHEEQVARLEVAVDDAEPVDGAERRRDARGRASTLSARVSALAGEPLGERLAVEPLHREVRLPRAVRAVRDVPHDAGEPERRERLRLAREAARGRCALARGAGP